MEVAFSEMARNIEIKARVDNPAALLQRALEICDSGPTEILQDDTFFNCSNGRLKLRELSPTHGELIFYRRADLPGPKESDYVISTTGEPETLRHTLTLALGISGRVRKRRTLFLVGNTRIHIDDVEGLGNFMELEVVLREGESAETGNSTAIDLMTSLGINEKSLVSGAYVDML